jgi:hypothetical protein
MDRYVNAVDEWMDQFEADGGFDELGEVFDVEELFADSAEADFFDRVSDTADADYGVGSPTSQSTTGVGSMIAHGRSLPPQVFENVVFPVGYEAQQGIQQQSGRRAQESIVDVSMPTPDQRRVNIEIDEQRPRMEAHIRRHRKAMSQAQRHFQRGAYYRDDPQARPIQQSPVDTTRSAFVLQSKRNPDRTVEIRKRQYRRIGNLVVPRRTETIRFPAGQGPSVADVIASNVLLTPVGTPHTLGGQSSIVAPRVRWVRVRPPAGTRAPLPPRARQKARRPARRFDAFEDFLDEDFLDAVAAF